MITIQAGYALVIDDEPANRDFVERLLQTASFKVIGASTGAEALQAAKSVPQLALALVDQQLPDSTGLEIIAKLRADNPETLLIMATMHDDRVLIDQAFAAGIDVFLVKPNGFMELYRRLKEVDSNTSLLRRLIIDQYGPRPYKPPTGPLKSLNELPTQPSRRPVTGPLATRSQTGNLRALSPERGPGEVKPVVMPVSDVTPAEPKPVLPPGAETKPSEPPGSAPDLSSDKTLTKRPPEAL